LEIKSKENGKIRTIRVICDQTMKKYIKIDKMPSLLAIPRDKKFDF